MKKKKKTETDLDAKGAIELFDDSKLQS